MQDFIAGILVQARPLHFSKEILFELTLNELQTIFPQLCYSEWHQTLDDLLASTVIFELVNEQSFADKSVIFKQLSALQKPLEDFKSGIYPTCSKE